MNINKFLKILPFLLTLATAITIFCFSAQPSDESTELSNGVREQVEHVVVTINPQTPESVLEKIRTFDIRSCAHSLLYFLLGTFSALSAVSVTKKLSIRIICPFAFSLLYSLSDELHQKFVEGRTAQFNDLCDDAIGYTIGITLTLIITYLISKRKNI